MVLASKDTTSSVDKLIVIDIFSGCTITEVPQPQELHLGYG